MSVAEPPHDHARLRARRVASGRSRRRRLARIDAAIGLLIAVVLLLASPGLAIAGIVALLLLAACGISLLWRRLRRVRDVRAVRGEPLAREPPPEPPPELPSELAHESPSEPPHETPPEL
jgi:hypothetical protein